MLPFNQSQSTYHLLEKISDHPPFEGWLARNPETGRDCFLKRVYAGESGEYEAVVQAVYESTQLQRLIKCRDIVVAERVARGGAWMEIEYPRLPLDCWQRLTPDLMQRRWPEILPQLGVLVDYLHLLGFVHGDLKLDNFMINIGGSQVQVRLIDLDFLQRINTSLEGRVFGTPGHIAPEVLSNYRLLAQSDNFSLGISLRAALTSATDDSVPHASAGSLPAFLDELTQQSYLNRPSSLLDTMKKHGIAQEESNGATSWRLLSMVLHNKLSRLSGRRLFVRRLKTFLRTEIKLLGVSDDLLSAAISALTTSRRKTMHILHMMPARMSVSRYGEYWHLSLDQSAALFLLDSFEEIAGATTHADGTGDSIGGCCAEADAMLAEGRPYLALRLLTRTLDRMQGKTNDVACESAPLLICMAKVLSALNHHKESLQYYQMVLERVPVADFFQLAHDACFEAVRAGLHDEARLLLTRVRQLDESAGPIDRLRFDRINAWLVLTQGELAQAEQLFHELAERAEKAQVWEVVGAAKYSLGVISWRMGDLKATHTRFMDALAVDKAHGPTSNSARILAILTSVCADRAEYMAAIQFGRAVFKLGDSAEHRHAYPSAYAGLLFSYTRLADDSKAEYYLQRSLHCTRHDAGSLDYAAYYLSCAFSRMHRGHLAEAEEALIYLLSLVSGAEARFTMLKVEYNWAELSVWRGEYDDALRHSEAGLELAQQFEDKASLAELQLFKALALHRDRPLQDAEALQQLAARLVTLNCRHYAIIVCLHMLIGEQPLSQDLLSLLAQLDSMPGSRRAPVFSAALTLTDSETGCQSTESMLAWKKAYVILCEGRQIYLSMLVARKIAQLYTERQLTRHARKYLQEALKHANSLGNRPYSSLIEADLQGLSADRSDRRFVIDSFLSVSELLKDVRSYRETLTRLIRFAVTETGAERGVLLLKRPDDARLHAAASYNCDEQSVRDVGEISANTAMQGIQLMDPLLIENAQVDGRTNRYASVSMHNILSVACIPLVQQEKLFGVLYLDHHSIAALFTPEDLHYMIAIGNFIVVAITAAKDLRLLGVQSGNLRADLKMRGSGGSFITCNHTMLELLDRLPEIACDPATVLLTGESGTGKEILCQMLHDLSLRAKEPLIKVNCAALAPTLVETELFGVVKGVATGVTERDGKFAAADGGTLFLDEIGDMPLDVQAKVLRVVEYRQFEKVGSHRPMHIDVRFVFATHRDLRQLAAEGRFRQDLYYRINTVTIEIPPLRERPEDIPLLLEYFTEIFSADKRPPRFDHEALRALVKFDWPGNVRQLRNVVEHCCLFRAGELVSREDLPGDVMQGEHIGKQTLAAAASIERAQLLETLHKNKGNQSHAANLLGMPLSTFRRKLKKHGIGPIKKPR